MYWGLLEIVMWISTRDDERVAAMWDMSEEERMAVAMFAVKAQLHRPSLLAFPHAAFDVDSEADALRDNEELSRIDGPIVMEPSQALDDVLKKAQSGRVQLIAIKCDGRPIVRGRCFRRTEQRNLRFLKRFGQP